MSTGDWFGLVTLCLGIVGSLIKASLTFGHLANSVKSLSGAVEKATASLENLGNRVHDHEKRISVLEARK